MSRVKEELHEVSQVCAATVQLEAKRAVIVALQREEQAVEELRRASELLAKDKDAEHLEPSASYAALQVRFFQALVFVSPDVNFVPGRNKWSQGTAESGKC